MIGGKGLFISKLEQALHNDIADIAVHSLKDVPASLDKKFTIAATLPREEVEDVLLLRDKLNISDLSKKLKIATSGPRRKAQLLGINSGFNIVAIRGNIQTRIDKMTTENLDGLIVAKAALNRLKISHPNIYIFSQEEMLPAAAQGAIGIEVIEENLEAETINLLQSINDNLTFKATEIERTVVAALQGNCLSPISALCKISDQDVELKVRVSNQKGSEVYDQKEIFKLDNKIEALEGFIEKLISNGAKTLIQK
jgi:hydroxymethylbilane synthase